MIILIQSDSYYTQDHQTRSLHIMLKVQDNATIEEVINSIFSNTLSLNW